MGPHAVLKLATKFKADERSIQTAVQAGFEFAELWLDATVLENWKSLANMATNSPLSFALHFPNRDNLTETHLGQAIDLYHALDCSAMVIHQPMLDRYGARLHELDSSVRLGLENHRLTLEAMERWGNDNRWLTLDVEHLWMQTLSDGSLKQLLDVFGDFLDRFHQKLIHVHLPGYVPGFDEHRPMHCSREMVLAVMSALAKYRFDGLVVSEVNPEFQNVMDLRMDVLLFERWKSLYQQESPSPIVAS